MGFVLGLGSSLIAQDTLHQRTSYIGLSLGLFQMKVKDQLVMPVRYEGANLNYALSYTRDRLRSTQEFEMLLSIGRIQAEPTSDRDFNARFKSPTANIYWGTIRYSYLHEVLQWAEQWSLQGGLAAYLMINARHSERWDNSQINYDAALVPAALMMQIERSLKTRRKNFVASFQVELPMIAYVMRPEFSGVPDFLDHERDFLSQVASTENSGWTSINGFPRITTELGVTLLMRNSNRMRLSYGWDYYVLQQPKRVRYASHTYLFTLYTHL